MGINYSTPLHHWNYYLAIEEDLSTVSRFIEFTEENETTYSIELARILISASAEVDVILRQLCSLLLEDSEADNINEYREVILENLPVFPEEKIYIPRFELNYKPWSNWLSKNKKIPYWWTAHNKVKHKRHEHFNGANLKNTINSVGGLLIAVVYYYKFLFESQGDGEKIEDMRDVTNFLNPNSDLLRLRGEYYYRNLAL